MEIYKSKVDHLIVIAFCFQLLISIIFSIISGAYWVIILILSLGTGITYFIYSFRYKVDVNNKRLLIHIAWFSPTVINISDIASIKRAKSMMAASAPSTDRIEIKMTSGKRHTISPLRKNEFIKSLLSINGSIHFSQS